MSETINLATRIEKQLPPELVKFMQAAGDVAYNQGQSTYLVGGVVRDLLLGKPNFDLDLVVEGNAITLAQQLNQARQGKFITHPRFNTAKLQWDRWSVDLATARSEIYTKPGALPTVKPGSIDSDLARRDFTINTMAIRLDSNHYGELIDLHGGRDDLRHKLVRVLHERSFVDDATRIWRGLRYEQRLDFQIEPATLRLLKRDIPMLDTISGDRMRHELELVLKEEFPEKALCRADELGVLRKLHPFLKDNGWLAEKFGQARQLTSPNPPPVGLYLALLAYCLNEEQREQLILRLRLPKALAQILRDTASIKAKVESLDNPQFAPSRIYRLLHGYSPLAITANVLASDSPVVSKHIQLFLNKLRFVRTALTGDDLKRMGVATGPRIKEMLNQLHEARLDGKVTSKRGEMEMVRGWVGKRTG
ncbi:CCA tRNA nucleotidyltransferase [Chloroflexota bacterium]